jgi:tetratricopeptide (TPR) repeat protein
MAVLLSGRQDYRLMEQQGYQASMREAADAAWEQDWRRAIEAYQSALEVKPGDTQAMAGLALSFLESGYTDQALLVYEQISQRAPNDPLPYEQMAKIYTGSGRSKEAAAKYLEAAEIFARRKDLRGALPNWEKAIRQDPDLLQAHMRLAVAYERDSSMVPRTVQAYLSIARLLQARGQRDRAEKALQRALTLDPINPEVRHALDDLRQGMPISQVALSAYEDSDRDELRQVSGSVEPEPQDKFPPVEEASRYAMGLLADLIFQDGVPASAVGPIALAIDAQQIEAVEDAIEGYESAWQAGFEHPAMLYNLGMLYQQVGELDKAVDLLSRVVDLPEYRIAAHMALGVAYYSQAQPHEAIRHLVEALRQADMQLNNQPDQSGYERLHASVAEQPEDQLVELCGALTLYLDDANWRARLQDTLSGYLAQDKTSYVSDLVELIIEGGRPEIAEVMQSIDMFLARGMLRMAMEDVHFAIQKSPDYLPAHRRMVDVMVREGRTEEAAHKLNLIADTYLIRGNEEKAADLYAEVIELWPPDIGPREIVLDMLKRQGRMAEALSQYADMADVYYTMLADPERAIEVYNEGLDYAQMNSAEPTLTLPLLKGLADIENQRVNYRKALGHYRRAKEVAPDDEEVTLAIVNLNFRLGETRQAVAALDEYMRFCVTRGRSDRIIPILEDQIASHPKTIALHQRLAEVYRQQRLVPEAIKQLDALGELQLEAGHTQEAIDTIRKIIDLNPPNVEGYHSLLEQLSTSGM